MCSKFKHNATHSLFVNLSLFLAKGWQKRKTEKAKGSRIPKILQKREISAGVELNM